jgi:hypothetical protein
MAWDSDKAEWYNRALKHSRYPAEVMRALEPLLSNCRTAIDVGAGCGALTIPLAYRLDKVTALEPAPAMLNILRREARTLSLNNIEFLQCEWGEIDAGRHDLLLCANVPGVTDDPHGFAGPMASAAEKYVVLIQGAGRERDKFYFRELYPLLLNEEYPPRPDYLQVYARLHEMGICADVRIIKYNLDQPFEDLEEAVAFWKSYLPPFPPQRDNLLRSHLEDRLEEEGGILWARMPKRSAVIWWTPE